MKVFFRYLHRCSGWSRSSLVLLCTSSLSLLFSHSGLSQSTSNIDNPVLPGVADAGVIRFNGEYYIGGVFTNGSFYKSRDLVNWEGPVHVFSMDNQWTEGPSADDSQIHANDINYVNGVFHHYWSVNYWGKDQRVVHIGHATAAHILGPYKEPIKDTWLDNRIDAELFIDDDGTPYFYMVKFTDGNTIWGRPMKDPSTFSAPPKYLFSSLPNTWETLDNRVVEGPWVIKYRSNYYLMYNANHTSPRWGNYMLGIAQADSPLGFHHGSKYAAPVVVSNQLALQDDFVDLLKYTAEGDTFAYTFEQPEKKWNHPNYDVSDWQKGKGGFGSSTVKNSTTRKVKTIWSEPEIWLRKSFNRNSDDGNLMLRIHHDGETKVFLNGELLYQHGGRQYTTWNFDRRAYSLLRDGRNVLAIQSTRGPGSAFLDVSLFDMKDQTADDILFSPGQPNILRGPNGFEWWLIYMANKNAEQRGQYINRIHFFDKRLVADAITGIRTPGHHPAPAAPTFCELFNDGDEVKWQKQWNATGGTWRLENDEVVQTATDSSRALANSLPAAHYLFESGVKMDAGTDQAGIYAWWQDEQNFLKVVLDQNQKSWSYSVKVEGRTESASFALPHDFNYYVYHSIRVFKNAADFFVEIDGRPAPGKPVITSTPCSGAGLPGLYTLGANARFDGVLYTIGWDEYDRRITGWGSSSRGVHQNGSWASSDEGLSQSDPVGENMVFKGDVLDQYEISAQITTQDDFRGSAGIYPVFGDADNYLKAVFDFEGQQFVVSGRKNGRLVERVALPLQRNRTCYADMRYTDFIEKHFRFDTPALINGLDFYKTPHDDPDTLIEDIFRKVDIFYQQDGKWHPLTNYREERSSHPGFDKIAFDPIKVEALKFVNKIADDNTFYIYKIRVNEVIKQSYNLRVARHRDHMIFFVDGSEVLRKEYGFPASQVGLLTEDCRAAFNGITFFYLPNHRYPAK